METLRLWGRTRRGGANRPGFTLIELLVVIAIISLLVSILLPSLGKAKDLAKAAMCGAQTRNIALAFLVYRDDWEFLPWPAYDGTGLPTPTLEYIGGNLYAMRTSVAIELEDKHGLDTVKAYNCPADPAFPRRWWDWDDGPPSPRASWAASGYTTDDYCIYTYLDGSDLAPPLYLAPVVNLENDAKSATHNQLTSDHAMLGDSTYRTQGQNWIESWHVVNTTYNGFQTAYGDAHIEWTDRKEEDFDDNEAQFWSGWVGPFYFWWK